MGKAEKDRHLGLRIDSETLYKLKYVSAYDDRSTNRQLLKWIREMIASFEQEHGEIPYPPEEEDQ